MVTESLVPGPVTEAPVTVEAQAQTVRSRARILVADHSPIALRFAASLLSGSGYDVEVAVDGLDVLGKLIALKPDLVLLDSRMPRLDGFQTCVLIRGHPSLAKTPVVILSGRGGLFDRIRSRLAGAHSCLSKPFTADELLSLVRVALADA
jgi:twitching motility two-component system response regulator PilG